MYFEELAGMGEMVIWGGKLTGKVSPVFDNFYPTQKTVEQEDDKYAIFMYLMFKFYQMGLYTLYK